ncbi:hypothetical protein CDL15_Pgr007306 [Punica granatum]|uniref:Uncharacterized protein n=1 Tax=Punica granatum TaxID=22663 RepID=A0A218X920_PUNGR|nr:hypothetical protein CDL15_Pgr007306 [Punica granatum]
MAYDRDRMRTRKLFYEAREEEVFSPFEGKPRLGGPLGLSSQGMVASMSRLPTFRRRFRNLVKMLYAEAVQAIVSENRMGGVVIPIEGDKSPKEAEQSPQEAAVA